MALLVALTVNCIPVICTVGKLSAPSWSMLSLAERIQKRVDGNQWFCKILLLAIKRCSKKRIIRTSISIPIREFFRRFPKPVQPNPAIPPVENGNRILPVVTVLGLAGLGAFIYYQQSQKVEKEKSSRKLEKDSERAEKAIKFKKLLEDCKILRLQRQMNRAQPYLQKMSAQDQDKFKKEWYLKGLEDICNAAQKA